MYGFVTAGSDTTGTSFVNAFSLLAEFGELDYAQRVLDDEDAMRRIVEEVLRFGTPFPTKPLFVLADAQFGDLTVPQGSVLHIWFAAANRDEAVGSGVEQSSPDEFDPRRWPNRHVALGWGKHFCLGGDLSRLETRILLQETLRRLPGLELDTDRPFVRFAGIVDGVTEAHFRFDQQKAERIASAYGGRSRRLHSPGFCRRVGAGGFEPPFVESHLWATRPRSYREGSAQDPDSACDDRGRVRRCRPRRKCLSTAERADRQHLAGSRRCWARRPWREPTSRLSSHPPGTCPGRPAAIITAPSSRQSGSAIQISSIASTQMACAPRIMAQESVFLKALASARSYSVSGGKLTLKAPGGRALVTFRAQSQQLAGTSWNVLAYNNGKQGVESVIAATKLTAAFAKDGNLSGFAGCNNYAATYTGAPPKISIAKVSSTRKECATPNGVMDQERQYLAALSTAATYRIEGSRLELRTASGATAAEFQRK